MHAHRSLALGLFATLASASLALAQGAGAPANPAAPQAQQPAPETPAQRDTMKAVRIHSHGDSGALTFEDAPKPAPGNGETLIRVAAAGVNPVDWKIRSGAIPFPESSMPFTLGFDVAGTVESVGPGVHNFKPGDAVFAYLPISRGGGYAQYVTVDEKFVARKPMMATEQQAAAVPLAALTAWQALFDTAGLREGQRVLIHAGAGGVGHFAVQLAKWKGATVYVTASADNHEFLKKLGADVCIDYKAQKFEEVATDMDVVLDSIGGETQERSIACLKPGGFLVSIVQPPSKEKLEAAGVRGAVFLVKPDGAQLTQIGGLIDSSKVIPHVSATFPLAEAAKAHDMSERGHTRGKIVLIVP